MSLLKIRYFFILLLSLFAARNVYSQTTTHPNKTELDQPTLAWMQTVLSNWEVVCRRHLQMAVEPLPWIIFYDENHAWHLNPKKELLPPHIVTRTSLKFARRTHTLIRVSHRGKLWVPGNDAVPIIPTQPPMATMLYANESEPFFITPLPAVFHKLAPAGHASILDEIFIGGAAHEMAHTRQLVYAARQIKLLRARYKLPESLDDNLIEKTFGTNADYKRLYDEEKKYLTRAVLATSLDDCRQAVAQVLAISRQRKERFFVGDKAGYAELEDIFLAMEGLAMWVQYQTARDRAPEGEDWLKTLITLSERTDAWSQEEGLGLFLLIDRLVPDWKTRFLAPDFPSPFAVLSAAINKPASPTKR